MKLCPMRFDGYTWHHNPKALEISNGKKVIRLIVPYSDDVLQNFGQKPLSIKGRGELYGEDCIEQYERLKQIYEKGDCAILCLPSLKPFYACFKSLEMTAKPSPSVLEYSFEFSVVKQKPVRECYENQVVVTQHCTLWDISYKYSIDVERLVTLNPQIMFTDDLYQEKVRLC